MVKVVVEEDVHTLNQQAAGLPTQAVTKTFFYGFIYGAGDAKIGKIVNQSAAVGKQLKESSYVSCLLLRKLLISVSFKLTRMELLDTR